MVDTVFTPIHWSEHKAFSGRYSCDECENRITFRGIRDDTNMCGICNMELTEGICPRMTCGRCVKSFCLTCVLKLTPWKETSHSKIHEIPLTVRSTELEFDDAHILASEISRDCAQLRADSNISARVKHGHIDSEIHQFNIATWNMGMNTFNSQTSKAKREWATDTLSSHMIDVITLQEIAVTAKERKSRGSPMSKWKKMVVFTRL